MYENIKGHPGFIAFSASETPASAETMASVEAEKDEVDKENETSAE